MNNGATKETIDTPSTWDRDTNYKVVAQCRSLYGSNDITNIGESGEDEGEEYWGWADPNCTGSHTTLCIIYPKGKRPNLRYPNNKNEEK